MGKADESFYNLRDRLVNEETLYEDEDFRLNDDESSDVWVRPPEAVVLPVFTGHPTKESGLKLRIGSHSSESFCVVVDLLTRKPDLLRFVVAEDQSFSTEYAGMFLFRFWRFGKVVPVIVDDTLPFNESQCLRFSTFEGQESGLWVPLLEKAYGKFLGSYDRLNRVTVTEAMTDILGCSVHSYLLKDVKRSSIRIAFDVLSRDGVVVAKMSDSAAARFDNGSSLSIVTSVKCQLSGTGKVQCFLSLRNPTGVDLSCYHEEDIEEFGEVDVNEEERVLMCANSPSVSVDQFFTMFEGLFLGLCRFPGFFSGQEHRSTIGWETQVVVGPWRQSRSEEVRKYHNPIIRLKVEQPDSGRKLCTVMISLMRWEDQVVEKVSRPSKIGLTVLALRGTENHSRRLPLKMLALSEPAFKSDMHHMREVCFHLSLQPGQYLLVPETDHVCCHNPSSEHKYRLTLFSLAPLQLLNGSGQQKYGNDFLTTTELVLTAPDVIVLGQPIAICVQVANVPPSTRLVLTIVLSLSRYVNEQYRPIKTRLEHIQLTSALLDKKLAMRVAFHEYARFPLGGEDLIAKCSAFVQETAVELTSRRTVTTILPTMQLEFNRVMTAGEPYQVKATLNNHLPITVKGASLALDKMGKEVHPDYPRDLPPFSSLRTFYTLTIFDLGAHILRATFTSELFSQTVVVHVQVLGPEAGSDYEDEGISDCGKQSPPLPQPVSCCPTHKPIAEAIELLQVRGDLFSTEQRAPENVGDFCSSFSLNKMCCSSENLHIDECGEDHPQERTEEFE